MLRLHHGYESCRHSRFLERLKRAVFCVRLPNLSDRSRTRLKPFDPQAAKTGPSRLQNGWSIQDVLGQTQSAPTVAQPADQAELQPPPGPDQLRRIVPRCGGVRGTKTSFSAGAAQFQPPSTWQK